MSEKASKNIVQMELFLVNMRADSLSAVMREMVARLDDNKPLKLSFRFFDEHGQVSKVVAQYEEVVRCYRIDLDLLRGASRQARQPVFERMEAAKKKLKGLRGQAIAAALGQFGAVVKAGGPVALEERYDRPLRMATAEEASSLLVHAHTASDV